MTGFIGFEGVLIVGLVVVLLSVVVRLAMRRCRMSSGWSDSGSTWYFFPDVTDYGSHDGGSFDSGDCGGGGDGGCGGGE